MTSTQNAEVTQGLSETFSKQASFANCENDQKAIASKSGVYHGPSSMANHKVGELTGASMGGKDTKTRAFAADITNNKDAKMGVANEAGDNKVLFSMASARDVNGSNPANQKPDRKDESRNIKTHNAKEADVKTTNNVIGPVANKPSGMQPQPSLTSRSYKSVVENQEFSASSSGHATARNKSQFKSSQPTTSDNDESKKSTDNKNQSIQDIFKERIQADNKMRRRDMIFADQIEMRDPQQCSEYGPHIYQNLRLQEEKLGIKADYLQSVQIKTEVKDTSRAFLVEWIIDVHRKFRLMPESLYLTVLIVDRYLSLQQIKKSQLHILGLTSILIATKYEEIYPPSLQELLSVSENKFTRRDVIMMEHDMLTQLEFAILSPSAYRFLERFSKICAAANDEQVFFFAQYIQEISLLDESLLKYRPSEIAAGSLILAVKSLKKNPNAWNTEMEKATGMMEKDLHGVTEDVRSFVTEVNPKFLTTLKYKFQKPDYKEVASLPFNF